MKFGLIGCSSIAQRRFIPSIIESEEAELFAIASRTAEKAESVANEFDCLGIDGYDQLLNHSEVDAVYISTPNFMHIDLIKKAAEAGKHIICEKSIGWDLHQWLETKKVVESNNVSLMEGFSYIYHGQHHEVMKIIKRGDIGKPRQLSAYFGFPPINSEHRYKKDLGGGCLLDAGVYGIHASRFFAESPLKNISSELIYEDNEVDIQGSVLLRFNNDFVSSVNFGFDFNYRNEYTIWGQKGHITVRRAFSTPSDLASDVEINIKGVVQKLAIPPENQFLNEINFFIENIENQNQRNDWLDDIEGQIQVIDKILS